MSLLRELIADRIRTSGPVSFAEFMELSLYHPELGYYARAAQKTGRAGDFFTSVDVGPIFGELLARQFGELWRIVEKGVGWGFPQSSAKTPPDPFFDLVEAGAGNGRLSRDVLDAAQRADPEFHSAIRLSLVERSAAARDAQIETLGPHAGLLKHSAPELPDGVRGVIFANELLDALPTHAVVMTESGLREVFVDVATRPAGSRQLAFVERLQDPSTPRIADYLSRAGAVMHTGARAEVNLAAEDWVRTAAQSLSEGFLIIVDYGHEEGQLYGGSHTAGTLTSFKRHTLIDDFLQEPGECDITTHVDLTAITHTAGRAGLDELGRLDQTYFLLGLGIADLEDMSLKRRLALKTLLLPGGLGSTHKVLIFGKNVGKPALKGLSYRVRLT